MIFKILPSDWGLKNYSFYEEQNYKVFIKFKIICNFTVKGTNLLQSESYLGVINLLLSEEREQKYSAIHSGQTM